jgi:hypothetical protein
MPILTISPGEMQLLLSRAGLVLNPGQVADLVLAWRQVAALIASIPHDRPLADDMALGFRLPPPAIAATGAPAVPAPKAQGRAQRQVKRRGKAKPAAKVKAKARARVKATAGAKRRATRPQASKGARRAR